MPRQSFWFFRISGLLFALTVPTPARASGRHLDTTALIADPHDRGVLYATLSSGYGLLATRDAGRSWRWICGRAIGTMQTDDPTLVVTPKGTLVLATLAGVAVSRDLGCSFSFVGGRDAFPLVHLVLRPDGQIVGVSAAGDNRLVLSDDDAHTFTSVAGPLDATVAVERVAVAASDRARIYLTGMRGKGEARTGAFFVSYDGARTWLERSLASAPFERSVILEATVDPRNADRVFVRTALSAAGARVLVTDDAGLTWKQVFVAKTWIHDVALSPDGAHIFVATYDGLTAATTGSFTFVNVNPTPTTCLAMTTDSLWACGAGAAAFGLGRSANGGTDFAASLRWGDLQGPVQCTEGSDIAETCGAEWPFQPSGVSRESKPGASFSATRDRSMQEVDITTRTRRGIGTFLAFVLSFALSTLVSYFLFRHFTGAKP